MNDDGESDVRMNDDGTSDDGFADEPLGRLRSFCLLLPETTEIDGLGHPTFRVATRSFALYESVEGRPFVCVKLPLEHQAQLVAREGFAAEPDTGTYGWTLAAADGSVSWDEIDQLVIASYRLVAPAEFVAQLDALLAD